jgi:cell division protein FtsB
MTKKQRILVYLTAIAIISLFFLIIFGDNGQIDLNSFKKQRDMLIGKNHLMEQEISSLYIEIDRAKNDPAYIEAVARQELGMIRKGEIILQFNEDMKKNKK